MSRDSAAGVSPGNAPRLAHRGRPVRGELLHRLGGQPAHLPRTGSPAESPAVPRLRLAGRRALRPGRCSPRTSPPPRPPRRLRAAARAAARLRRQLRVAHLGPLRAAPPARSLRAAPPPPPPPRPRASTRSSASRGTSPTRCPCARQPQLRVALAQLEPVLRARGEHPERLVHALASPARRPAPRRAPPRGRARSGGSPCTCSARVDAREQPLERRLLVARGAVELPGEVQARGRPCVSSVAVELRGRRVVVLDRVAVAHHLDALQPRDGAQELELHVRRQAVDRPAGIHQGESRALGLEEHLVPRRARRSAPPCPRATGSSAAPGRRCPPGTAASGAGSRAAAGASPRWCR